MAGADSALAQKQRVASALRAGESFPARQVGHWVRRLRTWNAVAGKFGLAGDAAG